MRPSRRRKIDFKWGEIGFFSHRKCRRLWVDLESENISRGVKGVTKEAQDLSSVRTFVIHFYVLIKAWAQGQQRTP